MDHLSPHTSCRWPCNRRSDCRGGVRMSLCRIMRSRLPDESWSAFQASAPGDQTEGWVRTRLGLSETGCAGNLTSLCLESLPPTGMTPHRDPGLLTNSCRVAFQHGELLPRSCVPDLHKALVRADGHQVPLGPGPRESRHQAQPPWASPPRSSHVPSDQVTPTLS